MKELEQVYAELKDLFSRHETAAKTEAAARAELERLDCTPIRSEEDRRRHQRAMNAWRNAHRAVGEIRRAIAENYRQRARLLSGHRV